MSDLFTIDQPESEPSQAPRVSRRGEALRLLGLLAGAAVVFGLVILIPKLSGRITQWTPAVGDCVTAAHSDEDVKDVKAVDCQDGAAASKVIAVYDGRDSNDMGSYKDPCANVPQWDSEIFYGQPHSGFILCLADLK